MNNPAIRFAGFTDDWEERKIQDLADRHDNLRIPITASNRVSGNTPYYGANGIQDYVEGFTHDGEFILVAEDGANDLQDYPVNYVNFKVWVNNHAHVLQAKQFQADNKFLMNALKHTDIEPYLVGGGRAKLNAGTMMEISFPIPTVAEQSRIGKFFFALDDRITLHQRAHDKTVNIKKALLEKMFPKDGEDKPEIRFAGFTDAWEQRKLGDVYSKIRNAFVGTATPYYVKEGHFYLESNNVKDGQINRNTEIFINDEFYERQKDNWLRTGDLVMVQSGHVGHTAIIPPELDNTAAHALIIIANPIQQINPYFLNYQFQTRQSRKKLSNITTGNTIKHILSSEIKKFCMELPCYDEQMHIGHIFINLDRLIALHKRELTKLQNIKKALLEKMFV